MMSVRWKRLLCQSAVWLASEIILTPIGMDDLADYGEYHLASKDSAIVQLLNIVPNI